MTMKKKDTPEIIFADLKGDSQATVVQSLCVQCQQNGKTTLLMTKIPFFKEILLMSFLCQHCGYKNNQVQFAGKLPEYGIQIVYKALTKDDLDRQIIKSENATLNIQELQLEIPHSKKAEITTFEGLLGRVQQELKLDQPQRKAENIQTFEKIQAFISKLNKAKSGQILPLTLKLRDPSGNSNIKNPFAPKLDKNLQISQFKRTMDELVKMGYSIQNAQQDLKQVQQKKFGNKLNFTKPFEQSTFLHQQPVIFDVPCSSCMMPGQMRLCQTSIPYFSDLVIMSFSCEYCGMHSVQTKDGGQIHNQALQITLKADNQTDLKRDLFKSQTCSVNLPEIQLQLDYGTLGGQFTTVEGLLQKIHDHLSAHNPFGDSDEQFGGRMKELFTDLKLMQQGHKPFTLILTDPLSRSFLQNPYHPQEDKKAKRVFRQRTADQNEFLGLDEINVDHYIKE